MDQHIDRDETQIYGPYATRQMRARLGGKVAALDGAVAWAAGALDAATAALGGRSGGARDADGTLRKRVKSKAEAFKDGRALMVRFSHHLDGHPAGAVDDKDWFVANGSPSGVKRNPRATLQALVHIQKGLGAADVAIRDAAAWKTDFDEAAAALEATVDQADDAHNARRDATPDGDVAMAAWMVAYAVGKDIARAVLRSTGQLELLDTIFHDLAVPANAKTTDIPDDGDGDQAPATDAAPAATPATTTSSA